jgi:hypothetical protein
VILTSPSKLHYRKVNESQLPNDVAGVARGAIYELEAAEEDAFLDEKLDPYGEAHGLDR